ncbi:MAG: acyl-CoA reductase [Flavobacteriaceae bacterium]
MARHHSRLQAFVKLGDFLREYCEYANDSLKKMDNAHPLFAKMDESIIKAGHANGWFTKEHVLFALEQWGNLLTKEGLAIWLSNYELEGVKSKDVAIIMAGNIPLVGFHDFLSALITGNNVIVKLSSNDKVLLPFIAELLQEYDPGLQNGIRFQEERLGEFDVIIATGSNNTARYFDYYFKGKPRIIRRNRVSIAVLNGKETPGMLRALGEDIFRFFGLGCRSVSKIFVPEGYSFDAFFEAIYDFRGMIDLVKYANNYDYNKAVYLMSEYKLLDNGFLLLKEDEGYGSPIGTLFYEHYGSEEDLKKRLKKDADSLQCIVSQGLTRNEVPFGQTQCPALTDYADGVDTVEFLLKTSHN